MSDGLKRMKINHAETKITKAHPTTLATSGAASNATAKALSNPSVRFRAV
jgi:hypothetical protein